MTRKGSVLSKRRIAAALVLLGTAACLSAVPVSAAPRASKSYLLKATLSSKQEVPAPHDATAAKGVFTAKLVVDGKKSSFVWQLRFSGLSGRATASHVHYGAAGKAGGVALPLCVPCINPAHGEYRGPYVATATFLKAILHGGAYVNIHTKLNPKGEIRGQIKAVERCKGGLVLSKKSIAAAALVATAASVLPALAQARPGSRATSSPKTYLLRATLDPKQQLPTPTKAGSAKGIFTARLTVAGKKSSFVWELKLSGLSGRATAGRVNFGASGKTGPVAIPLCVPCTASAHGAYNGPYVAIPTFLKAILHGGAYANVNTKLNPKGEIRGQIKGTATR
jgi:hypothetical protein